MKTFLLSTRIRLSFHSHSSFPRHFIDSFSPFLIHLRTIFEPFLNHLRSFITMKCFLTTVCVLMLVSWTSATFGPWMEKPLAVVLRSENETVVATTMASELTMAPELTMSDEEVGETTTASDVVEESNEKPHHVKSGRCIKSSFFEVVRQARHQLRVLYHWTVSLLSIPVVFLRDSLINLYSKIGDAIFTTFGYVEPECRYKVICEFSSLFSSYIPTSLQDMLEGNLNSLVGMASRARLLNADSEYIQAAFVGSMERNCSVYEDAKC